MKISEIIAGATQDMITEGRDAPLYHGTTLENAIRIAATNEFYTGINWRGEGERVALTRSYDTAKGFAESEGVCGSLGAVIFVMDQAKLAQRYRLRPHRDTDANGEYWGNEQEEMVIGGIKPAEPYIVSINVQPKDLAFAASRGASDTKRCLVDEEAFKSVRELNKMLKQFVTHPKLNVLIPRGYR